MRKPIIWTREDLAFCLIGRDIFGFGNARLVVFTVIRQLLMAGMFVVYLIILFTNFHNDASQSLVMVMRDYDKYQ
jgi:hypothetical protein